MSAGMPPLWELFNPGVNGSNVRDTNPSQQMHEMKEVSHIFASEPHFDIVDCAALPESGVDTIARRTDSFKWLGKDVKRSSPSRQRPVLPQALRGRQKGREVSLSELSHAKLPQARKIPDVRVGPFRLWRGLLQRSKAELRANSAIIGTETGTPLRLESRKILMASTSPPMNGFGVSAPGFWRAWSTHISSRASASFLALPLAASARRKCELEQSRFFLTCSARCSMASRVTVLKYNCPAETRRP